MTSLPERLKRVMAFDEDRLNKIIRQTNWNGPLQIDGFAKGSHSERARTARLDQALVRCVEFIEYCAKQDSSDKCPDAAWLTNWRNDKKILSQKALADLEAVVQSMEE